MGEWRLDAKVRLPLPNTSHRRSCLLLLLLLLLLLPLTSARVSEYQCRQQKHDDGSQLE